jgi:hypothetical protein
LRSAVSEFVISGGGLNWLLMQNSFSDGDLKVGDHAWYHVVRYGKLIQHHGIWVGSGVIHFDGEHDDDYYVYRGCQECSARRDRQRREGTGNRCVRLSCFRCFSHWRNVYRCEYGKSRVSQVVRETGSRSTSVSYPGYIVASVAWGFYLSNSFGNYDVVRLNCEDFTRWCKVRKLGSKQVYRGLVLTGTVSATTSLVGWVYSSSPRRLHKDNLRRITDNFPIYHNWRHV